MSRYICALIKDSVYVKSDVNMVVQFEGIPLDFFWNLYLFKGFQHCLLVIFSFFWWIFASVCWVYAQFILMHIESTWNEFQRILKYCENLQILLGYPWRMKFDAHWVYANWIIAYTASTLNGFQRTLSQYRIKKITQARVSLKENFSQRWHLIQYVWKWSEVCKFRISLCRVNMKPDSPHAESAQNLYCQEKMRRRKRKKR
jgi:hypothetical protein